MKMNERTSSLFLVCLSKRFEADLDPFSHHLTETESTSSASPQLTTDTESTHYGLMTFYLMLAVQTFSNKTQKTLFNISFYICKNVTGINLF